MRHRHAPLGVISVVVAFVLVAVVAACSPTTGTSGPPVGNFEFAANKVTVVSHNDSGFYGSSDEPFVYNLWFSVSLGVPNSAKVGIVGNRDNAVQSLGDGESAVLTGGQRSAVDFNGVPLLDVGDLLTGHHLEIVGTWTWAMEEDDVSVEGVADSTIGVMQRALNATVAAGSVPTDTNALVGTILGNFNQAFDLIAGALFASIPGIPDDAIGSKFLIGLGTTGTLGSIVDSQVATAQVPSVAIPIVTVPPDINGGHIFSLSHNSFFKDEVFDSGQGRHDYDLSVANTGTSSLPADTPPVASFSLTQTSGSPPLPVTFDASTSGDPDGSIASYSWDFGDFTSGTGLTPSHVFTTGGVFPVTLTVTDNQGDTDTSTVNVTVAGGPTVAPTGLKLVGSGCCDTYGDFTWNEVPGATGYEIHMDAHFGGGCLTDADTVFDGQRDAATLSQFGLCLGSHYDTSIRAEVNGNWGPWSPSQDVGL